MSSQVSFAFCALSASNVPGPIFNRQSIACPASSCLGRCGPTGPEDPWACYCDPLCRILRDCCPDAGHHCFSGNDSHIQIQTLVMDVLKSFMECRILDGYYSINHDFSRHKLIPMSKLVIVTSCPVGTGNDLADACQSKFGSPLHALPACHPQHEVVFFNTYCALCHGYALEDLTMFEADVSCSPEDLDFDITDVENFWKKCFPFVQVFLPPKCLPSMRRQQCLSVMEGDDGGARCLAYRNPVTLGGVGPTYRNQFCIPSADIVLPLQCLVTSYGMDNMTYTPMIESQFSMLLDTRGRLHVIPANKRSLMDDIGDVLHVPRDEPTKSNGNIRHVHDMISLVASSIIRMATNLVPNDM